MIRRQLIACMVVAALASTAAPVGGAPANPAPAAKQTPVAKDQPPTKPKAKPRRVIIFGTTIVGDVLKPPVDKTVPWQRPAAFRSNAPPLTHDFMTELLTPLDRDAILRDAGEHAR